LDFCASETGVPFTDGKQFAKVKYGRA
jgi:hypothetical protein